MQLPTVPVALGRMTCRSKFLTGPLKRMSNDVPLDTRGEPLP